MKYLLDTCTFYWMVDDQSQLSNVALKTMGDPNNLLYVSVITLTELHRLIRKGKISILAPDGLDAWFRKGLTQHQVTYEPITLEIVHLAETLPAIHHDPADRWMIATAQIIGAKVLTPDRTIPQYPSVEVCW